MSSGGIADVGRRWGDERGRVKKADASHISTPSRKILKREARQCNLFGRRRSTTVLAKSSTGSDVVVSACGGARRMLPISHLTAYAGARTSSIATWFADLCMSVELTMS